MGRKKEERIEIGRQIYDKEITRHEAMIKYEVSENTIDNYSKEYKLSAGIPLQQSCSKQPHIAVLQDEDKIDIEKYQSMSKDELIDELIRSKANELRAKKGYEVKGSGAEKEFSILKGRNSK